MEAPGAAMSENSEFVTVRVRNLQDVLDMSNLGIKAIPRVFADMLEEYVGGKVKHVDLSGNGWNEPQCGCCSAPLVCPKAVGFAILLLLI